MFFTNFVFTYNTCDHYNQLMVTKQKVRTYLDNIIAIGLQKKINSFNLKLKKTSNKYKLTENENATYNNTLQNKNSKLFQNKR